MILLTVAGLVCFMGWAAVVIANAVLIAWIDVLGCAAVVCGCLGFTCLEFRGDCLGTLLWWVCCFRLKFCV